MRRVAVQGIGVVGGFGCGVDALARALTEGHVPVSRVASIPSDGTVSLPALLADTAPLEKFFSKRAIRRIDHFSRLSLLGACLALTDAGLFDSGLERMGVIVASGYGAMQTTFDFLDTVIDDGDICASPTHFSGSVHNAAAAHIAMQLKATGPNLTVSQFEMSFASAMLTARLWLQEGRVDRVLLGAVDEYCGVLGYCRERFFGTGPDEIMKPFDFTRHSAIVGEGAAFFVLSAVEEDTCYGTIIDAGLGNLSGDTPALPEETIFFLGADGHGRCGIHYKTIVPDGASVAAYAPLYGSLPTGQAFDLAIAALSVRDGRIPASPGGAMVAGQWKVAANEKPDGRALCCLKTDSSGGFGYITIKEAA
ncbi:MAG: beta-ketoacyl synthase chain length factor [Nitrospirota bacterium]|nr:beta-ketoacyl synthase chain length factor [Nitrospirota bacterium]